MDQGIEIEYDEKQVEDIRQGVERDFSRYLGYPCEVRDDPETSGRTVGFRIFGVAHWDEEMRDEYRRIFWRHMRRVAAHLFN